MLRGHLGGYSQKGETGVGALGNTTVHWNGPLVFSTDVYSRLEVSVPRSTHITYPALQLIPPVRLGPFKTHAEMTQYTYHPTLQLVVAYTAQETNKANFIINVLVRRYSLSCYPVRRIDKKPMSLKPCICPGRLFEGN